MTRVASRWYPTTSADTPPPLQIGGVAAGADLQGGSTGRVYGWAEAFGWMQGVSRQPTSVERDELDPAACRCTCSQGVGWGKVEWAELT